MVTIDYRELLERLGGADADSREPGSNAGSLMFTGPITASTVRKIACDADIIPMVLGGEGRILDIGRASRVFPPHIRKGPTARDGGCAFPQGTIPAPWCEERATLTTGPAAGALGPATEHCSAPITIT